MLAACTSESENGPSANISFESFAATQQVPVTFGTYLGETPTTRAGYVGPIENATILQNPAVWFGVFGYYTDHSSYVPASSPINFMYNQKVEFTDTDGDSTPDSWNYSPIKYWPNETNPTYGTIGNVDDGTSTNDATSAGGPDKLTFFAYAPYVSSATGSTGITGLPTNAGTGDPLVSYAVSQDALNSVDLMWGLYFDPSLSPSANATPTVVSSGTWGIAHGKPFIDLIKPQLSTGVSTPVNFTFKHALARLDLTVQATRDKDVVDTSRDELWDATVGAANKTKIVIDYVKLSGAFPLKGDLNLNNSVVNKPNWTNIKYSGDVTTPTSADLIIEGDVSPATKDNLAASLRVDDRSDPGTASTQPDGVKVKSSTKLLKQSGTGPADSYFMFIPDGALRSVDVEIRYFVITDDAKLKDGKSVVENKIKKTISVVAPNVLFEAGKAYTWNLVLGMETVSINATVASWDAQTPETVDLPINVD